MAHWPVGCRPCGLQEVTDMIERRKFPTPWENREIAVVTEQLRDGRWGVVVNIEDVTPEHTRTVDLPVPDRTFESRGEAESFALEQAQHWLEHNLPRSEAA
jgi:hypothetical protein